MKWGDYNIFWGNVFDIFDIRNFQTNIFYSISFYFYLMFTYTKPIESIKRLLQNDLSGKFNINLIIKRIDNKTENIMIEHESKITISSTINKARIISEVINEEYIKDPTINQFTFDISKIEEKMQRKLKTREILKFFNTILNQLGDETIKIESDKELNDALLKLIDGKYSSIICEYNQNNKLNGIISYIRKVTNGSIDINNDNLVLSAGTNESPNYPLSNIIKYDDQDINKLYVNYYANEQSHDIKNTWIKFDFVQRKINVTSYTIRLYGQTKNFNYYPKSWKIMGSNSNEWELIDEKINVKETNGNQLFCHFECERKSGYFRYIKFIQLDNHYNNENTKYATCISCIEFFGSIA